MRDINYNYTWFTGCDSRGLAPLILCASSPPHVHHHHTRALLKLPQPPGYRRLFPHISDDPLHSELLNKHVRTKPRRVACAVVLKARLRVLLATPLHSVLTLHQRAAVTGAAAMPSRIVHFKPTICEASWLRDEIRASRNFNMLHGSHQSRIRFFQIPA